MIVISMPRNHTGAVLHEEDINELRQRQVKELGGVAIPTSAFYADGNDIKVLRFRFAKKGRSLQNGGSGTFTTFWKMSMGYCPMRAVRC